MNWKFFPILKIDFEIEKLRLKRCNWLREMKIINIISLSCEETLREARALKED